MKKQVRTVDEIKAEIADLERQLKKLKKTKKSKKD